MAFFANRPDILTPVRWFFADVNAGVLPVPTRFASGNWASQKFTWPGCGEVLPRNRRWSNGANVPFYAGLLQCGTDDQFLNGTSYPPAPFPRYPDGVPYCCDPPVCEVFWGIPEGTTGGYVEFTLAGFTPDGGLPADCSALDVFNATWDDTLASVGYGSCNWVYTYSANPFFSVELFLDNAPDVTLWIMTGFGTDVSAEYRGSVPVPVPLPVTWPVSVSLDDTGTGSCEGLGVAPPSLSLTMMLRADVAKAGAGSLVLKIYAAVVWH